MEIYSGDIPALISRLQSEGYQHAYIDGGMTITSFLNLKLIDEMTITQSPILLGEGIALFGRMNTPIRLLNTRADVYPNDFIQIRYDVGYQ
jgi:dihydrofolate reductase